MTDTTTPAAAAAEAGAEADTECAVCRDLYCSPVRLRCGHAFCRLCAIGCTARRYGPAPCPLCRAPFCDRAVEHAETAPELEPAEPDEAWLRRKEATELYLRLQVLGAAIGAASVAVDQAQPRPVTATEALTRRGHFASVARLWHALRRRVEVACAALAVMMALGFALVIASAEPTETATAVTLCILVFVLGASALILAPHRARLWLLALERERVLREAGLGEDQGGGPGTHIVGRHLYRAATPWQHLGQNSGPIHPSPFGSVPAAESADVSPFESISAVEPAGVSPFESISAVESAGAPSFESISANTRPAEQN